MSTPVVIVTAVGRESDFPERVKWFEKPSKMAVAVSRAGPVVEMPEVEKKGAKSWIQPPDGHLTLYVSENFEALCKALDAKTVTG